MSSGRKTNLNVSDIPAEAQAVFNRAYQAATGSDSISTHDEQAYNEVAWAAVHKRFEYDNESGEWTKKAGVLSVASQIRVAVDDYTPEKYPDGLPIEGGLIELDVLNLNGWGVRSSHAEEIVSTLPNAALRKCSGFDAQFNEHSCDVNWNPNDDKGLMTGGRVEENWIEDGDKWIVAEGLVKDPDAIQKVLAGTWLPYWSVYQHIEYEDSEGFCYGNCVRSVTMVDNPAYPNAGFSRKTASVESKMTGSTKNDKSAGGAADKTFSQEDVDGLVAAALADIRKNTMTSDEADKLVQAAVAEAKKGMLTEADVNERVAAALEKITNEDSGTVSKAEANRMVEAGVKAARESTIDQITRERLASEVVELKIGLGLTEKAASKEAFAKLMEKSAADLTEERDTFTKMTDTLKAAGESAVNEFKNTQLPSFRRASVEPTERFTVGHKNSGSWSNGGDE